jgi:hypothetical protein
VVGRAALGRALGYLLLLAQPTQSPSALREWGEQVILLFLVVAAAIVYFQPSHRPAAGAAGQQQATVLLAAAAAEVLEDQALLEQAARATRPVQHQAKEATAGQARMRAATEKVVAVAGRLL